MKPRQLAAAASLLLVSLAQITAAIEPITGAIAVGLAGVAVTGWYSSTTILCHWECCEPESGWIYFNRSGTFINNTANQHSFVLLIVRFDYIVQNAKT